MRYVVLDGLSQDYQRLWDAQFISPGREYLESIWRRSEEADANSKSAGKRRRIIHVIDKYSLLQNDTGSYELAITDCYLWLCSTLPRVEVARYVERFKRALTLGSWLPSNGYWTKDDLKFSYRIVDKHPEDLKAGRDFGTDYQTIECTMVSNTFPEDRLIKESPWAVYNTGIRTQGTRVPNPKTITDMRQIVQYLPAQVELGGGASLELGIPPLNYFHTVYNLYTKNSLQFAFGDSDELLDTILADPAAFYSKQAALPYARALTAEPNYFYKLLAELYQKDIIIGPIITNNFDGICSLLGLPELYVRKYDEAHIVPDVRFAKGVKSLLVIGSHADRRRIQQAAKAQGLKILYVDPEEYIDHQGNKIAYPLEKIEADDILIPLTANNFALRLSEALAANEPVS